METFIQRKYKQFYEKNGYVPKMFNVYNSQEIRDIAPTLTTSCGTNSGSGGVLIIDNKCKEVGILQGGKWDKMYDQSRRVYSGDGSCPTLHTCGGGNQEVKVVVDEHSEKPRIRKLTPLECWKLMGFTDEDFRKAEKVCSNSQLYKQAGNSIVVQVLEGVLRNLLPPQEEPPKDNLMDWLDNLLGGEDD